MKRIFLFIAILCAACTALRAQSESDLGLWSSIHVNKGWSDAYAFARVEHRSYEQMSATDCWFALAGVGYKLTDWLKADLSCEHWELPSSGDASFHKAVACVNGTLKSGALAVSVREKYELKLDSLTGTMRTRLRAQYGFSACTPYVMYEFFNGFSGKGWVRSLHYFGTEIKVSKHSTVDLFYMYNLYPTGGATASCHVLGAGYVLSL